MSLLGLETFTHRTARTRGRAAVVLMLAAGAAVSQLALTTTSMGDYSTGGPVAGDNAGPAVGALIHGHISSFVSHQPLMGLTSLILRAPFTGAAALLGSSSRLAYGFGALACLLPLALLAVWMVGRRTLTVQQKFGAAIAGVLMLIGPATAEAVHIGHPEEVLAATLATGAVLAAIQGRTAWGWCLLGLAVGTKQWALLAAPCVILALPDRRVATAAKAGGLALVLSATLPLADPAAFARADSAVGGIGFADPFSLWWPISAPLKIPAHAAFAPTAHALPFALTRSAAVALGLIVAFVAMWLYWTRRPGRGTRVDPLALLALCGLARCLADPTPLQYNFVALLIPLAAWETVVLGRLPLVSVLATGALALLARGSVALNAGGGVHLSAAVLSTLSIAWTLTLACYLARRVVHLRPARDVTEFASLTPAPIRQGA